MNSARITTNYFADSAACCSSQAVAAAAVVAAAAAGSVSAVGRSVGQMTIPIGARDIDEEGRGGIEGETRTR